MSGKQKWGRKETIVWPPHAPIYTLSALAVGFSGHAAFCLAASPVFRDAVAADIHDHLR